MMSLSTTRPMSLIRFDFNDLYARHLGRHSQFGINVAHLAALYGLWFGVYATIAQAAFRLGVPPSWPLTSLAVIYLGLVATNAPLRVSLATAAFLAVFVVSVLALPRLPGWSMLAFLLMIPAFYKIQAWSHRIWTVAADMTEFNRRFPPGRTLRLILLIYEIPICLNYLIFERKDWR
jgi:hypothetical protein